MVPARREKDVRRPANVRSCKRHKELEGVVLSHQGHAVVVVDSRDGRNVSFRDILNECWFCARIACQQFTSVRGAARQLSKVIGY